MLVVCGATLITSFSRCWPTLIVELMKDNSTNVTIDQEDIKWLATSGSAAGFVGPFLASVLSDVFGPRLMLVVSTTLPVIFCPMVAFLPSKPTIWASRIGMCTASFMIFNIMPSLSAELISPNIRGLVGAFPLIYYWFGIMAISMLIKYLSWHLVCLVITCLVAVIMVALCFVPESPYWLLRKGRDEDSQRALETLRGHGTNVENELMNIKMGLEQQPSYTIRDKFVQLVIPSNYKPILLMMAILIASNMTGIVTIFQYAYLIVPETGVTDLDPMTGIITLAMAGFVSSGISSSLVDRCGRRPLLIGSALLNAASLLAASVLMIFPVLPAWVALLFIHVFVFSAGLGSYTVPLVLTGEMIPTAVRYVGIAICMVAMVLGQSLLAYVFPVMVSNIGLSYTFVICSFFSIFLAVFTWKWVPETKGKSLVELQKEFMNARSERLYSRVSICKQGSKAGIDISPEDLKRLTDIATNAIHREEKNITKYRQRSLIFNHILQEYIRNGSKRA